MWPLVIVDSKSSKQINMIAHRHILIILFWVIMLDYNRPHWYESCHRSVYFIKFVYIILIFKKLFWRKLELHVDFLMLI
jgi:hypothetical protein